VAELPKTAPAQQQQPPGRTDEMQPRPHDEMREYTGRGLLAGQRALVTGGDSGIGRAVSIAFAKEGADVAIAYFGDMEEADAKHTARMVQEQGRRCRLYQGDLGSEDYCGQLVDHAAEWLGGLNVLVNHAGTQRAEDDFAAISTDHLDRTFKVNVYGPIWLIRAALPHLRPGASIINTGSVNGLRGNKTLMTYAASKGAVHVLTKSLAQSLVDRGIRVNCVAPGPVWTPLIPSTLPPEKVEGFGEQVPMERMAHPDEIAPSYVFFAAEQVSGYYTGEVLAPVGGETHPG
jgi:NAD(P)-dependent dehydrogenase (short-subunit alcohol dehydrogenase family)